MLHIIDWVLYVFNFDAFQILPKDSSVDPLYPLVSEAIYFPWIFCLKVIEFCKINAKTEILD